MLAHYQLSPTCTLPCRTDNEHPLTWYSELKRLIWHAPVHLAATLRIHTDEVLHVSFSPDGRYFCTSSKDCSIKVFSTRAPYTIEYEENDLHHKFHWRYTQYTEFNASGQLLLVSGTTQGTTNGEIVVFALIGTVSMQANRPYDVFGTWFDDTHLLSGEYHRPSTAAALATSISELWLCTASQETHTARTGVLASIYKFVHRNGANLRMILCSDVVSNGVREALLIANWMYMQRKLQQDGDKADALTRPDRSLWRTLLFKEQPGVSGDVWPVSGNCEVCATHAAHNVDPAVASTCTPVCCTCICHVSPRDRLLIFTTGSLTYTPHQVGFKLVNGEHAVGKLDAELMPADRRQRIMSSARARIEREQLAAEAAADAAADAAAEAAAEEEEEMEDSDDADSDNSDNDEADGNEQPAQDVLDMDTIDYVAEMRGHVIGISLTNDKRFLLVNVRPWLIAPGENIDDMLPFEPPRISNDIELRIIDLHTLGVVERTYVGHRGNTDNNNCFFIFASGTDRTLVSGSETAHGFVWSRDYGCQLGVLEHEQTVSAVSMNPRDEQMCVSVSDDYVIKVWASKARLVGETDEA